MLTAKSAGLADTPSFPRRVTVSYGWIMRWMRRRGERVTIIAGKYAGHTGSVESNVYQRTVDHPDELANGHHIMLDTSELVTVRHDQVETIVVADPSPRPGH